MEKTKIYLAGGMNSNWQLKLLEKFHTEFVFFNPRDHSLDDSKQFSEWDLFYVKRADIVFAFMEKDNPSGIGLTLEVGVANALGKLIILVDEKSSSDEIFKEKFKIVREASTIVFDDINEGIKYLSSFLRINKSN
jgi:nucleoside 2-deoxyribosyltransferase